MKISDYPEEKSGPRLSARYTDWQLRHSYEGRKVCDAADLGAGYCGSCPFSTHVAQMNDPESWVHGSYDRWMRHAPPVQPEAPKKPECSPALKRSLKRLVKRYRDRQAMYQSEMTTAADDGDLLASNRYEGIMTGTLWAAEDLQSLIDSL